MEKWSRICCALQILCAPNWCSAMPRKSQDVPSIWKQRYLGKRSKSARRYETRHGSRASTQETGARPFWSGIGTHLSEKEVITDAFSNNEANTQDIERVKIGSDKICIREDLAKEKMVFSKETSHAISENGHCGTHWIVEIIGSMPIMLSPRFWNHCLTPVLTCTQCNLVTLGRRLPLQLAAVGNKSLMWSYHITRTPGCSTPQVDNQHSLG